jgi:hypothetical protein
MKAETWKEVTRKHETATTNDIAELTYKTLKSRFGYDGDHVERDHPKYWNMDSVFISVRIQDWKGYPDAVEMVERNLNVDRIEKEEVLEGSVTKERLEKATDIHLPHFAYEPEAWDHVYSLFSKLTDRKEDIQFVENYIREFRAALEGSQPNV